ncbi:hypothetical protein EI42_04814 [Thermosporothrix hazakensis]|jgi:cytochrome c oxidase assembly protein Cox11|uniref:Uncharacterized protein n=1 Tax=Thermosporothrix hazakensis TaxID=644383 RepID=A0A326U1R1_THEHA|nr:hypothetical protein EI42_04814 [Thermosporothrix hazakensis]
MLLTLAYGFFLATLARKGSKMLIIVYILLVAIGSVLSATASIGLIWAICRCFELQVTASQERKEV